jgi:hypothetical protein
MLFPVLFVLACVPCFAEGAPFGREPVCSKATEAACPSLNGDACLLCAGKHYAQLQAAGCNDTAIEYACHHVGPAAALAWLEDLSSWIVALGIHNGTLTESATAKCSPCSTIEDRNHIFVNGNMARVLLATWRLQRGIAGKAPDAELLAAGLGWCDSLCDQQATIRTSRGNVGGFWGVGYPVLGPRGSIYFGDTGTAVTTLALGWHLSANSTQKVRYLETMERYAAFVLEGSSVPPPGKNGTCDTFISPVSSGVNAGAVGCGYYSHRPSTLPYTIATGTTGAAFFSELFTITQNSTYASVVSGSIDYLARVMLPSGEIPYILDGRNSSTAHPDPAIGLWPFDTIAYDTEGIAASALHFPDSNSGMVRQFKPTVDYLLTTQGPEGFWGKMHSSDLERSPRVLSLLSWWINATTRGGAKPYVDLPSTAAADKFVSYLVAHGVSRNGDEYGVGSQTITSGMAGIAVADWLSFGASFGVTCDGCEM